MRFEDIHYVRPDAQELSRLSALTQLARSADSAQELASAIREVNDIDKHVYTMLTAGKIRYAQNTQGISVSTPQRVGITLISKRYGRRKKRHSR